MDAALELAGVGKTWEGFALRDVSFRLAPGYITGLVGPNGAGKTTLVKLVLDLVRPDAGTIRLFGRDHRTEGAALRSRIGFVHDSPTCYDHLPVVGLGALVASFYPSWEEETFQRLLREFELPPRRKVSALSRGMRVKLGLALALSHRAELLILDEPTTGLDFVVFLRGGRVVYEGVKDDLVDRWAVVRAGAEIAPALEEGWVRGIRKTATGFEVLTDDIETARRRFGERAVVERATLDDVFLLLGATRREGRSS